jgi:hypothetical protein
MNWEYYHLFRNESESQDWVDSDFLNEKGQEGWELVQVLSVERSKTIPQSTWVDEKKIKEIEWHYYLKRPCQS